MNESPSRLSEQSDDLWLQIGRICDGEATPEEVEQLDHRLQATAEARELFVAYLSVHAELQWRHRGASSVPQDNGASAAPQDNRALQGDRAPIAAAPEVPASPVLGFLGVPASPVLGFLGAIAVRPFQSLLGLILIAATLYYGTFALFIWNLRPDARPAVEPAGPALQPVDRGAASMARIAHTGDCQWHFEGQASPRAVGSPLAAGELLELASGVVEVEFRSGAVVVLEGPARFRVETAGRGFLLAGKLLGKVPPPARGFTVDTQDVRVIDLGTEFGVTADGTTADGATADGATQVEVFRGEVSLAPNQGPQSGLRTRLAAGDAARVTRDGAVTTAAPRPEGYVGVGGLRTLRPALSSAASSLSDRFDDPQVDASKWLVRTDIPTGGAAVSIDSGWLKLVNRGYLVSRAQFQPTPERPLTITGTCRIRRGDMLQIITRSDGVPDKKFGEVNQGIEFAFFVADGDGFQVAARGPQLAVQRPVSGDHYVVEGKLVVVPNMTLRFEILDAGTNVAFTLSELDKPANSQTVRAQVTLDRASQYHVVLHNRELSEQEHALYVDDLRIEQSARSDDKSASNGPGEKP